MINWLRRRASDYFGIAAYLTERDAAVAQREAALAEVDEAYAARDEALQEAMEQRRMADGCRAIVKVLLEPGLTEQCTKVRLRDKVEADAFGARVQADTGAEVESYKCRRCPRQPVSTEAFWHITHTDPAKRGQNGKADPPKQPSLLRHVTPADVAAMRARANGREVAS